MVNGFSEQKISYLNLLPLPEVIEQKDEKGYDKPTDRTKKVLSKLVKEKKLSFRVLKSLAPTGLLSVI